MSLSKIKSFLNISNPILDKPISKEEFLKKIDKAKDMDKLAKIYSTNTELSKKYKQEMCKKILQLSGYIGLENFEGKYCKLFGILLDLIHNKGDSPKRIRKKSNLIMDKKTVKEICMIEECDKDIIQLLVLNGYKEKYYKKSSSVMSLNVGRHQREDTEKMIPIF